MEKPKEMPFAYPLTPHVRRHGLRGYLDYRSFKPWLRDEFAFRCVFCLWRELWAAGGDAAFSVEHLLPQSTHPKLVCGYNNLVYACCHCNAAKSDQQIPVDLSREALGEHIDVSDDGTVRARTDQGVALIDVCSLNRPLLVRARRRMAALVRLLDRFADDEARRLLNELRSFPDNLPPLATLTPPGGNEKPGGIAQSFYELGKRGELPATY